MFLDMYLHAMRRRRNVFFFCLFVKQETAKCLTIIVKDEVKAKKDRFVPLSIEILFFVLCYVKRNNKPYRPHKRMLEKIMNKKKR